MCPLYIDCSTIYKLRCLKLLLPDGRFCNFFFDYEVEPCLLGKPKIKPNLMISCFTTQIYLVKQRLDYTMSTRVTDTSHDTSTNILKIYSKCGVGVTLANKRNTYINESHLATHSSKDTIVYMK